jgi:catechol 2,3-dioxygenase-like lactoylglutathione lyase family enzyme
MHHVDVHVTNGARARAFLHAIMPIVGYVPSADEDGFASFRKNGQRPTIGVIADGDGRGSGAMRLAFAVPDRQRVDAAAAAAIAQGARNVEGPAIHEEYGDYYAVFFEDHDGNKYEVAYDPECA